MTNHDDSTRTPNGTGLPSGQHASVPRPLGGPAAWDGATLRSDPGLHRHWSPRALDTFDAALNEAQRSGLAWNEATRERFDLAAVEDEIDGVADALERGPGIVKLSGLPVGQYSPTALRTLFYGLGHWLGRPVFQTAEGELLGDIRDEGDEAGERRGQMIDASGNRFRSSRARAQSSALLRWHTDRTDVTGLLCVGVPARGGVSRVASAVAVHDEMVRRRPDLAGRLYRDLVRSHLGEEAGGATRTYALPVWGVRDGHFATHYSRTFVEAAQQLPGVTPLEAADWEALNLLSDLADELCHEMVFEPGDMQFINNHVTYHARGAYQDDPATGRCRSLYRIWLAMRDSRPLPAAFEVLFGPIEPGTVRGGIRQADGSRAPALSA